MRPTFNLAAPPSARAKSICASPAARLCSGLPTAQTRVLKLRPTGPTQPGARLGAQPGPSRPRLPVPSAERCGSGLRPATPGVFANWPFTERTCSRPAWSASFLAFQPHGNDRNPCNVSLNGPFSKEGFVFVEVALCRLSLSSRVAAAAQLSNAPPRSLFTRLFVVLPFGASAWGQDVSRAYLSLHLLVHLSIFLDL